MHTREYLTYLKSQHWFDLRESSLNRANRKCEVCKSRDTLQGHHLVYRDNLEDCTDDDIMALCKTCHDTWHQWLQKHSVQVGVFCRRSTWGALMVLNKSTKTKRYQYELDAKTERRPSSRKAQIAQSKADFKKAIAPFIASIKDRKEFKKKMHSISGNHSKKTRARFIGIAMQMFDRKQRP